MSKAKLYKRISGGSCGHIEGITGEHHKYFRPGQPGVFFTEVRGDTYILVEPEEPDGAPWIHPELGPCIMWNTHSSGELRWMSPNGRGYDRLEPGAVAAAKFFGLRGCDENGAGLTEEQMAEIFAKYEVGIGDLNDEEIERLVETRKQYNEREYSGTLVTGERGGRNEHDQKSNGALYSLQNKGMLNMTISSSGPGSPRHNPRRVDREGYRLTSKGAKVREQAVTIAYGDFTDMDGERWCRHLYPLDTEFPKAFTPLFTEGQVERAKKQAEQYDSWLAATRDK